MRTLVITFFFFVLLFGFGSIVLSSAVQDPQSVVSNDIFLGQASRSSQSSSSVIMVDREDDPHDLLACSSEPADCSLRSALAIANNSSTPIEIKFASDFLIRLNQPLPTITGDNVALRAQTGQEIHIHGSDHGGSVLRILGSHVTIHGLRIYGAGAGYPNLVISGSAHQVTIANNIIGDDDAPFGNCGSSDQAYSGIYVEGDSDIGGETRAWIYGNVIECHRGFPGDGIILLAGDVVVGKDQQGNGNSSYSNIIRNNRGIGVNLLNSTGNTVCDNLFAANGGGAIFLNNFHNNNVMYNDLIQESENEIGL